MIINYVKNRWLIWCDENSCVNWGYFFPYPFAFRYSGVGGSCVFFIYSIYPQPNTMGCISSQNQFGLFSLKEWMKWGLKKIAIITFPTYSALVKLLLEGSVYNKCLVSGILQFHRPWQLGMKSGGIMSIVNEYAIYILIKLCTIGVKECHLEHPGYSVYIIVVYLNSPLFGMSQLYPQNAIL